MMLLCCSLPWLNRADLLSCLGNSLIPNILTKNKVGPLFGNNLVTYEHQRTGMGLLVGKEILLISLYMEEIERGFRDIQLRSFSCRACSMQSLQVTNLAVSGSTC